MHKISVYRDKRNLGFAGVDKLLRRAAKAALKASASATAAAAAVSGARGPDRVPKSMMPANRAAPSF